MGLEAVTYISDLVSTNPAAGDYVSAGDDHIRRIKTALLNTFPNITAAVTATHTELNKLAGMTATKAELNKLAGLTATTAELNKLAGVTATSAQINKLANLPLAVADGGTGRSTLITAAQDILKAVGDTEGDILYHNGTNWVVLPKGTALQQLRRNAGNTAPEWATVTSGSLLGIYGKFTSGTATATRPAGATKALIRVQGGGGNGDYLPGSGSGAGGGSGAFAEAYKTVSGDLTVTVGGVAGTSSVAGSGFTTITAAGGSNANGNIPGAGGALPTTGDINLAGQAGSIDGNGGGGLYARGGDFRMNGLYGGGGASGGSGFGAGAGSPGFVTIYWYA